MTGLTTEYIRVNCCGCGLSIAWAPISNKNSILICDLCRLDECMTLKWLGLITTIMRQTEEELNQESIKRMQRLTQSDNLSTKIREYGLLSTPTVNNNLEQTVNLDDLFNDINP